jgi:2-octaprenyl-6-methoxyphenol hydroxylase
VADPVVEPTDILIAGGGPVGAALALALEASGLSVVLVESRNAPSNDARPIALSHASRLILERLGAWNGLAATPIETIHVSQRGGFGRTVIRASDYKLPALGYMVSYGDLQRNLFAASCSARRLTGARLIAHDGATATVQTENAAISYAPRLTVLADGARMAEDTPASSHTKDYHQTALVARVKSVQPHHCRAWERFTPQGPLALLPQSAHYALIWTTSPERAAQLCTLAAPVFLAELHAAFGDRLGEFVEVSDRTSFPLALRYRREETFARTVAIGNAAQTLHPVAGQGLNLGLRDAWELARLAREATDAAHELGSAGFLTRYRRVRGLDRSAGIHLTDMLVSVFSNADPLLRLGRGAGLLALDLLPSARGFLARRMIYGARALP